jgi:hypothetical protein
MEKPLIAYGAEILRIEGGVGRVKFSRKIEVPQKKINISAGSSCLKPTQRNNSNVTEIFFVCSNFDLI